MTSCIELRKTTAFVNFPWVNGIAVSPGSLEDAVTALLGNSEVSPLTVEALRVSKSNNFRRFFFSFSFGFQGLASNIDRICLTSSKSSLRQVENVRQVLEGSNNKIPKPLRGQHIFNGDVMTAGHILFQHSLLDKLIDAFCSSGDRSHVLGQIPLDIINGRLVKVSASKHQQTNPMLI
jgi:hypothetical protein